MSLRLRQALEEESYEVAVAYDGKFGQRLALEQPFDLLILDTTLPDQSGLQVLQTIRVQNQRLPVLLVSDLNTRQDKLMGLTEGADDYLVKPFDIIELLARVRALTRPSSQVADDDLLQLADITLNPVTKKVERAGQLIRLTALEFKLLELLLRHQGHILSRKEIAEHIWEGSRKKYTNTLGVYVNYLRNKVDKEFRLKLLHTVVGKGYILSELESA